ncbi:MAG: hypothetical protein JOZ53_13840 [Planctomycetaceae bacterium]|nr:hypothetical protein [Planctomycetaceae bacterium]
MWAVQVVLVLWCLPALLLVLALGLILIAVEAGARWTAAVIRRVVRPRPADGSGAASAAPEVLAPGRLASVPSSSPPAVSSRSSRGSWPAAAARRSST